MRTHHYYSFILQALCAFLVATCVFAQPLTKRTMSEQDSKSLSLSVSGVYYSVVRDVSFAKAHNWDERLEAFDCWISDWILYSLENVVPICKYYLRKHFVLPSVLVLYMIKRHYAEYNKGPALSIESAIGRVKRSLIELIFVKKANILLSGKEPTDYNANVKKELIEEEEGSFNNRLRLNSRKVTKIVRANNVENILVEDLEFNIKDGIKGTINIVVHNFILGYIPQMLVIQMLALVMPISRGVAFSDLKDLAFTVGGSYSYMLGHLYANYVDDLLPHHDYALDLFSCLVYFVVRRFFRNYYGYCVISAPKAGLWSPNAGFYLFVLTFLVSAFLFESKAALLLAFKIKDKAHFIVTMLNPLKNYNKQKLVPTIGGYKLPIVAIVGLVISTVAAVIFRDSVLTAIKHYWDPVKPDFIYSGCYAFAFRDWDVIYGDKRGTMRYKSNFFEGIWAIFFVLGPILTSIPTQFTDDFSMPSLNIPYPS